MQNRIIFDHFGNLAAVNLTAASHQVSQSKKCQVDSHSFTEWEFVETTHYGDKDIYQRVCLHCGITSTTVSRLHPDANK